MVAMRSDTSNNTQGKLPFNFIVREFRKKLIPNFIKSHYVEKLEAVSPF